MDTSPPAVSADFGYHNDKFIVDLCTICADRWHWSPDVTLNQDKLLVLDMIQRVNLQDAVDHAREEHHCLTPEDVRYYLEERAPQDVFENVQEEIRTITFP